jgi:uncharacterized low-complexity protein
MTRWIFTMAGIGALLMGAVAGAQAQQNQAPAQTAKPQAQQTGQPQSGQTQAGQNQSGATQSGQAPAGQQAQTGSAGAQQNPATPAIPAPPPAARATDVASPDAILAATYDVISGPAGQKRDWDRFRSLFLPGARLVAVVKRPDGGLTAQTATPEQYAAYADTYFQKNGFAEREIARHADRYGDIMQIFSTYESRRDPNDETPFARGINSFQLFYDGTRWWVVTIYWQEESPENPLPKEYLPAPE